MADPHPVAVVPEAIAALAEAAGCFRELKRPDQAQRCSTAAAKLQRMLVVFLPDVESPE
jgi:hypothetical protein